MKSIFHSRAIKAVPTAPKSPSSEGNPTNGSPGGGLLATIIGDHWYYMITQELLKIVESEGLTPDAENFAQVNDAIDRKIQKLKETVDGSFADLDDRLVAVQRASIPTGMIAPFGTANAGDFWLLCDGRAVSRELYRNLFSVIGTTFGEGNGTTTFNLPDLRNRFAEGSSDGSDVGQTLESGGEMADHYHVAGSIHANNGGGQLMKDGSSARVLPGTNDRYWNGSGGWQGQKELSETYGGNHITSYQVGGGLKKVQPPAVKLAFFIHS